MQSLPIVELRDASKTYGPVHALRGVTLACKAGEVHAIIGENGAGKSTMMKLLSGVMRPSSGAVAVDGQAVALRGTRDASRRGIVCIFQELSLMPALSVGDNIVLARPQTRLGFVQGAAYVAARACLDRIGAERIAHTLLMSRSVWHKLRESRLMPHLENLPLGDVIPGFQPTRKPVPGRIVLDHSNDSAQRPNSSKGDSASNDSFPNDPDLC